MPSGELYVWIIGGCFGLVAAIVGVLAVVLYMGHVLHRRRTGSKAGFLEVEPPPEVVKTAENGKEA